MVSPVVLALVTAAAGCVSYQIAGGLDSTSAGSDPGAGVSVAVSRAPDRGAALVATADVVPTDAGDADPIPWLALGGRYRWSWGAPFLAVGAGAGYAAGYRGEAVAEASVEAGVAWIPAGQRVGVAISIVERPTVLIGDRSSDAINVVQLRLGLLIDARRAR